MEGRGDKPTQERKNVTSLSGWGETVNSKERGEVIYGLRTWLLRVGREKDGGKTQKLLVVGPT